MNGCQCYFCRDEPQMRELYIAVNEMMAALGLHGEIGADSAEADKVMDALHTIDGGIYDAEKVFGK